MGRFPADDHASLTMSIFNKQNMGVYFYDNKREVASSKIWIRKVTVEADPNESVFFPSELPVHKSIERDLVCARHTDKVNQPAKLHLNQLSKATSHKTLTNLQ